MMSGPMDPARASKGSRATFLDLSSDDVLRSPSMVRVVQRIVELTMPAKKRKMVQLARLVANPMLKQQMTMLQSPMSVTRRLPIRSARYPQNRPVVPPKAYAHSRILRR
jgi:hypothetical protein